MASTATSSETGTNRRARASHTTAAADRRSTPTAASATGRSVAPRHAPLPDDAPPPNMALSAADFDRLLDAGLIPVSKVPLTGTGRYAVVNLGEHTSSIRSGTSVTCVAYAVDCTLCTVVTDGDGIDCYPPLALGQIKQDSRTDMPLTATRWAVTPRPLAFAGCSGSIQPGSANTCCLANGDTSPKRPEATSHGHNTWNWRTLATAGGYRRPRPRPPGPSFACR